MHVPRWLLTAVVLSGCRGSAPQASYTVRDSAGVTIVESSAPAWGSDEAWTVSAEPVLHIGLVEGAPEYQFTTIAGLFEDTSGRIVAADRSGQIRFYDQAGAFLGAFGREGEGPGEFRLLTAVFPIPGDSILTWDRLTECVSVFDAEGAYTRSVTLPPLPMPALRSEGGPFRVTLGGLLSVGTDGTLIVRSPLMLQGRPHERVLVDLTVQLVSSAGDLLGAVFPVVAEVEMADVESIPRIFVAYERIPQLAAHAAGMYVAQDPLFEIEDRALDGTLRRLIRATHVDLTMTEARREAFRESERTRLAVMPDLDRAALERALAEVAFPPTVPPASQLVVDAEENLWVRHYALFTDTGPQTWSVFDPEGYLLGTLETPERLQVRQIGRDFLLGIWTDDLDVRYVRKYALER